MNKDKEPLMSAEEWILIKDNSCDETWSEDTEDLANEFKRYAKYHTEWHKNNETTNLIWCDDFMPCYVVECCNIGPIINEKFCPQCGKKIQRQ